MALPKEPRQKMINLMYLVLTAILALNVSAEILNAFKTVNNSLETTNKVIGVSTDTYMKSLEEKRNKAETKEKADLWYPKAAAIQQVANTTYNSIQGLKDSILRATGFDYQKNKDSSFKEDDIDAAQRIIVEGGEGKKLFESLKSFREKVLSTDPLITKEFGANFPVDLTAPKTKNEDKRWEAAYFHMTPTVAALTILSKFQNDVRTAENRAIEFCHNQVGHVDIIYDQYSPLIGQSSNYLMPGQELVITAGVGSYNSAAKPQITIDGSPAQSMPDGSYQAKTTVGGTGSYSKRVHITYFNQAKGITESKDAEIKYTVGSPTGLTITPDAVKVLYIGLANPVSITGGTKGAETYQPSITQGRLEKKDNNGHFVVTGLSTPGEATISVTSEGKTSTEKFRVRTIPPPTIKVGNSPGGRMSVNEFKAQLGVRADMGEFIFEGVKYDVTDFTLIATGKGFESTGPRVVQNSGAYFSADAKAAIEQCKAGSTIVLDRVKVVGPDGSKTIPGTIAFNLSQ